MSTGATVRDAAVTASHESTVEPALDEATGRRWQRLPALTLRAWYVDSAVGLTLALAVLAVLRLVAHPHFLQPWLLPLAGLAVGIAVLECLVLLPRRHRSYRYAADDGVVVVETGVLLRRQLVVPTRQVLYVETRTGPVLRAYGLAHVHLGTIADPKSVGPVTAEAAAALRAVVEAAGGTPRREDAP